jgi:hypothetical protein
VTARGDIVL